MTSVQHEKLNSASPKYGSFPSFGSMINE